ncbi:alpha-L-fucosidase [Aporhodopirellula aestuarii]|uniref:alpha-L-fucosidase n=1 Tax=Aporhodopirellula aestuarii TaxID=2950107 RepID=A0ABT0TZT3_9BACT|nr:alpha-L-fucosidase [Aporhodopirellula aestuarii]MCM2370127.1 alpha-L-fucosidase [Aporhodopirellula aestuarii]
MTFPKLTLFIAMLTIGPAALCNAQGTSKPNLAGDLKNDPAREQEFIDWGLGMFVHWSLDSQLGSVISHSMDYASRKYLDRYVNELPKTFNPTQYDPDKWMEIAKLAGMKYMVFTTKHHSGFCMWDTKTTDFNIMNTPYGKDIVASYVDACRRHGIKVGFYYSPEDFAFHYERDVPARGGKDAGKYHEELVAYTKRHLDELLSNYGEIDVIFLDGGHKEELTQYVHQIAPRCIVTRGEMVTPEQKLPKDPIPGPWETCFTLGNQWQYKPTNEDYKSGTQLINMLVETRAKGGNLLINMGPMPSGIVPLEQEERFRELALWMFVNDEAIHDTRPCVIAGSKEDGYYTRSKDGKYVYAVLTQFTDNDPKGGTQWGRSSRKEVLLKDLKATPDTKISVLGQEDRVEKFTSRHDIGTRHRQTDDGLEVSVVRAQRLYNNRRWPNAVVLRLENVEFAKE